MVAFPRSTFAVLLVVGFLFVGAGVVAPIGPRSSAPDSMQWRQELREQLLAKVQNALQAYHDVHGRYPTTGGQWQGDCGTFGGYEYGSEGYIPGLVPDFMPELPRDPDIRYPYYNAGCVYRSDGQNYKFMLFHTPEGFPEENPFEDPLRPFWAWQVSSPGANTW